MWYQEGTWIEFGYSHTIFLSVIFKLFNYLKISPITPTNPASLLFHVFVRKINLKKNLTEIYPSLPPCAEMTQSAPVQISNFMLLSDNTRIRTHRIQISNTTKLTCKCPRCNVQIKNFPCRNFFECIFIMVTHEARVHVQ